MPRYYFDLHDGAHIFLDHTGAALHDDAGARTEAALTLTEVVRDLMPGNGLWHDLKIVVRSRERGPLWETALHWETRLLEQAG